MEWLLAAVQTDLSIDGGQLALGEGGQLVALVPVRWLGSLRQSWPGPCPRPEGLNQAELSTLLQASVNKLPSGWARISIQGLRKSRLACWLPSEPLAPDPDLDSFCGFMSHVAEQNYQNLWREAHERFARPVGPEPGAKVWATPCLQALKASLSRVLGCSFTWVGPGGSPEREGSPDRALGSPHPNLLPAEALLESAEALYLVQLLPSHTLRDALTFSPAKLAGSHTKVLFVLYQALQAMRACHHQGLACGTLTPTHLSLDERLFTRLRLNLADYEGPEGGGEQSQAAATPEEGEQGLCGETGSLRELVTHWVHGRLSNFAYLMALNRLAGRRWGDPNYHPVLPWVTDFTSPHGRLRDLRKSKFRLNKGDRQLDFTYREAGAGAGPGGSERLHVPHHIPDVLSDITYYVYRARRTPRSLLCRHVRSQWEPHEYPGSVERMQAWTPDECIPEFYTDPTVFQSIHDDMPDLEVPAWCGTPAGFVAAHRRLLESPEVSLHLHHWVDLTFGHRLSGKEAVRAKNVCLPLVDAHTHLTSYGVVQLFDQPHPQRLAGPGWEPAEPPAVTRRQRPGQRRLARPVPEEEGGEAAGREPVAAEGEEETGDLEEGTEALDSLSGLEEAPGRVSQGQREGEEEEGRLLLPQGFNPLQALEELERLGGFLTRGLQGPPPQAPPQPREGLRLPHLRHLLQRDMQAFGVLVAEMFFAPRLRLLGPEASLDERLRAARQLACSRLREVAGPLQQAVVTLLQPESEQPAPAAEALPLRYPAVQEGLPPPSPDLLLSPCCPTIPFPAYFPGLYRLACSFPAPGEAAALLGRDFVFSLWQQLEQLLDLLEPEGLDILLPFVLELLSADATAIYAAWYLFEPLARALGPRGTQRCLLGPLSAVYERPGSLPGRFYLYTDCFVLQLLVRLGLRPFLTGLLPHILQVLTGLEGPADSPGLAASLEDEAGPTEGKAAADYLGSGPELAESEELPPGIFPAEAEAEAAGGSGGSSNGEASVDELGPDPDPEARDGLHLPSPAGQELRPPEEDEEEEDTEEEEEAEATAVLCSTPEAGVCEQLRQSVEEDEELSENKEQKILLDTACKTVKWLSAKLGPTLSSRHIVRTLLRLLVTCYFGVEKQQFVVSSEEDVPCVGSVYKQQMVLGDVVAQPVLDCLVHVAQLYGEPILTYQCLPYVAYLVAPSNSRRLNSRKEAGLLAAVVLMHKIIVYLSDTTLMDILPKINQDLLLPVLEVLTSPLTSFPGGAPARSVLGVKTLGLLALVCLRIGQEMVMQHMTEMLGRFLLGFSVVHDLREKLGLSADARDWAGVSETELGGGWDLAALEELEEVFSLEMAYSAYVLFNCLIGDTPSQQLQWDDGRVRALAARYQEEVSAWASGGPTPPSPDASQPPLWWGAGVEDGQSGIFGSGVVGNRIEVAGSAGWPGVGTGLGSRAPPPHEPGGLKQDLVRSGRWLDGNWLAHWQYEVGRAHQDQRCHFHQIPLQCFRGHTSAVRALCPLPAEDFFLSAGRDRTVRLWPLYNQGDGSHAVGPRLTYAQHRRPVFATQHLDTLQQVASCDGTIHIWDPFTGKSIRIFDGFDSRNPITAVTAMPSPHCSLLVGTSDSLLHFIDPRKPGLQHEFRLGMNASAGLIRCMAISPSGRSAAVGFSSGYIYLLDIRTGLILKVWPAHESDILQLKCAEGNVLVSSSTDHSLTVWTESEPKPVQLYKSPSDPVHTFDLYGDEIVAGTVANRIGIYSLDGAVPAASSKLSLENFRGVLTSLAVLPAKRLLLLGSDNGSVRLLA
ncbi:WD repeat-containing protein 81 isoform X2 [Hemitrygon akajei]